MQITLDQVGVELLYCTTTLHNGLERTWARLSHSSHVGGRRTIHMIHGLSQYNTADITTRHNTAAITTRHNIIELHGPKYDVYNITEVDAQKKILILLHCIP